jgi:hypothetical protein
MGQLKAVKEIKMKKALFFVFCLFVTGLVFAGDSPNFSPIYLSSDSVAPTKMSQPRLMLFNYPSGKNVNCITEYSLSATNFPTTFSIYILDGQTGTTAYTLAQTTSTLQETFYKENPLCLSPGTTTYLYVSSGNFKLNALGYEKSRN